MKISNRFLFIVFLLLGVFFLSGAIVGVRKAIASAAATHIAEGAKMYYTDKGRFPPRLPLSDFYRELRTLSSSGVPYISLSTKARFSGGVFQDVWRTNLKIDYPTSSTVRVSSAGRDKVFGTSRDISITR